MTRKITGLLSSRWFFVGVLVFFALEALWIAWSALFPMAFDEDFHFGIIKIYSDHLLPFLSSQPEGADVYGAVATDPSYLYHYLMSWPYKFIELLTDTLQVQVIFLRVINIAMFGFGLLLFYKVLLRAGASTPLANIALALFVLIPIVPLLAGQINYDNLLMPLAAGMCLLVFRIMEVLQKRQIDLKSIILLAILIIVASLVKYPFLPLAFVAVVFLAWHIWRSFKGKKFVPALRAGYDLISKGWRIGLLVGLILTGGLFAQRYGANLVNYKNPVPDCAAVIGKDACMNYGPWARNYNYAQNPIEYDKNPIKYTWTWLQSLHYRLFFMITGPPKHTNYPPVPFPAALAIIVGIAGAVALILHRKRVFAGRLFLLFLLLMSLFYVVVLWFENYSQFAQTGRPVAINGRYLLPILLPLAAVFGRALSIALFSWPKVKIWAASLAVLLFLQGGGVFSFILRSDSMWYWPSQVVVDANQTAQKVFEPVIFQGPKHY